MTFESGNHLFGNF